MSDSFGQVKGKAKEVVNEIADLLSLDDDKAKSEGFKLLDTMGSQLKDYYNFTKGKGTLQEWIEENRIIRGKPFSYSSIAGKMMLGEKDRELKKAPRPYLTQYINDRSGDKSTIKCRQSEFTESEINENIWLSATRPYTNVRHIFPTAGMAQQIAREKISPAVQKSPRIAQLLKRPYGLTSKNFINGSFYTVDSSWTDHGGRGPSSDKITFDEYESQNPNIEDIYSESTSHSDMARKTRISTPKFPDSGIDEKYKRGCGYEWFVTCPKCKKEQILEFPENIINYFDVQDMDTDSEAYLNKLNKVYVGCKFCGSYIDRSTQFYIKTSRWVALRPHLIPVRASYRVTYMMLPWKTAKEILYKYHTFKFIHQWWNEVMGFAYISPEAQVTREIFEQCQDASFVNTYQRPGMARNISIGIDWGEISWVVVRANGFPPDKSKPRIIYVERIDARTLVKNGWTSMQTDHVKRVAQIIDFFKPTIVINDANGIGVDRNSYLVRQYPMRVYGCFYDTAEIQRMKKKETLIVPAWNDNAHRVTVSRVSTFKLLLREYEEKGVYIPRLDNNVEEFIKHHTALAIERYQDEKTSALYEVVGHTGPDHYAHADNYAKIGFDKIFHPQKSGSAGVILSGSSGAEPPVHPLLG